MAVDRVVLPTPKEKAIDVALDLTKLLITLASALVATAIAIIGLRYPPSTGPVPSSVAEWVVVSSVVLVVSIMFGLAVHAGAVAALRKSEDFDVAYKSNIRFPSMIQWVVFISGVLMLVHALSLAFS